MNRLTNEQKVHVAFLPFYGHYNRTTEAAIRGIVTKFRTKFTLLDIKPPTRLCRVRTEENMQLYRPVLMMTINYRCVAVRSNWASVSRQGGRIAISQGFRCEAFQSKAGARIEAERPTASSIFGNMLLKTCPKIPFFLSK